MRYLSVCSGIEAATSAWHSLGWTPFGFAEIEAFPSAVLAHHYGSNLPGEPLSKNGVPNFGDLNGFKEWPREHIDLLVGGTPCQSFSVAGLRRGLEDPRGNLCLTFLGVADRYKPEWLVWENVPGVLSSNGGRDFGSFLGALSELGYGWAYRVLDAQYIRVDSFARAVPQRRRRVFVVGHLGDWRRAASVLFERESVQWDSPPRRQAGQGFAADVVSSLVSSGRGVERPGETRGQDPVVAVASTGDIAHCLNAGGMGRIDYETETMIAHALRADGFDAGEDDTGRGTPIVPIAFSAKDYGADAQVNLSPTLRAGGFTTSHANAGVMPAIAFAENSRAELRLCGGDGAVSSQLTTGGGKPGQGQPCIAFDARQSDVCVYGSKAAPLDTDAFSQAIATRLAVRRLMPVECERLQGFPDNHTAIPYRGKPAADGPRYKALGNSMAVNSMRWIGRKIQLENALA